MSDAPEPDPRNERLLAMLQKALGHELPNQLLAIQGLARLLEMELGENAGAEAKDYLTRVAAGARRAHELSRTLAEVIRAGRADAAALPVSFLAIARQAAAEAKQLSPPGSVEYHIGDSDLILRLPGSSLRQAVAHILRYVHQTGPSARPLRIDIGTRPGGEFWIADNGPGLTDEQRGRLFEPFRGTGGLGLFLVCHVVESWGGSVHVSSTPGNGATFTVTLPAAVVVSKE